RKRSLTTELIFCSNPKDYGALRVNSTRGPWLKLILLFFSFFFLLKKRKQFSPKIWSQNTGG
ncbi:MAG: hypothetical protein ACRC4J_05265, partial [Cetobacterium sp.]